MSSSPSMPSSETAHPSVFNLTESATINIRNAQYSLTVQASIPPHMGSSEGAALRIWLMKELNEHVTINPNVGSIGITSRLNHEFKRDSWYGEFDGAYVEAITRKTGNYKKFGVFVEMLLSSLKKTNPTVHLDLLTSTDLLTLKSSLSAPVNLSHNQVSTDDKRYLILVYSVAYDRVHYPIPLIYHPVNAEPTMLISMIRDLQLAKERLERDCKTTKEEIVKLQNKNSSLQNSFQNLQTEKSSLEQRLQVLNSSRSSIDQERVISDLRQELDMVNRELEFALAESEKWRRNYDELKEHKQSKSRESFHAKRSTSYSGNCAVQSLSNSSQSPYNSTYTRIRSKPLSNVTSSPVRVPKSSSQSNSRSPFKRFDPTQWAKEQEEKRRLRQPTDRRRSLSNTRNTPRSTSVESKRSIRSTSSIKSAVLNSSRRSAASIATQNFEYRKRKGSRISDLSPVRQEILKSSQSMNRRQSINPANTNSRTKDGGNRLSKLDISPVKSSRTIKSTRSSFRLEPSSSSRQNSERKPLHQRNQSDDSIASNKSDQLNFEDFQNENDFRQPSAQRRRSINTNSRERDISGRLAKLTELLRKAKAEARQ